MSTTPPTADWGHGPNKPVPYWTEVETRAAMGSCMNTIADSAKIELVMTKLKEARR